MKLHMPRADPRPPVSESQCGMEWVGGVSDFQKVPQVILRPSIGNHSSYVTPGYQDTSRTHLGLGGII